MSEEKVTLSDGKEAARQQILDLVAEYCDKYHNQKKEFTEGQRIPYASRVYDNHEMVNLVDSALEFWLTSGRYTDQFEAGLANYLGVKYCSLVNSGSSANLIAFMALTSPLLGERRVRFAFHQMAVGHLRGDGRDRDESKQTEDEIADQ